MNVFNLGIDCSSSSSLLFQLKNAFDNLFEGLMESKDGEKEAAEVTSFCFCNQGQGLKSTETGLTLSAECLPVCPPVGGNPPAAPPEAGAVLDVCSGEQTWTPSFLGEER